MTSALCNSMATHSSMLVCYSYYTCTRLISREIEGVDGIGNQYHDNRPRPVVDKYMPKYV